MIVLSRFLFTDHSGQDLIEYALIAALIGLGAVASVGGFATALQGAIASLAASFQSAV